MTRATNETGEHIEWVVLSIQDKQGTWWYAAGYKIDTDTYKRSTLWSTDQVGIKEYVHEMNNSPL